MRKLLALLKPMLLLSIAFLWSISARSQINLADKPIAAGADVPGNLALTLSVEFPTAISIANLYNYADSSTYLGYFDPAKCYTYNYNSTTPASSYFAPSSIASGTNGHICSGYWSGNYMNWAAMQTIDPFRWALTGGYRSVDTTNQTILEKAWGSTQGSVSSNFPYRGTSASGGSGNNLPSSSLSQVTPFSNWSSFNTAIWGNGNSMVFSGGAGYTTSTTSASVIDLSSVSTANTSSGASKSYRVYIRVSVCDTTLGTAMLESNCVKYGSNYKPEGLLQSYSKKIRFSAFGYLNQGGNVRQGGAMRAPMGFIGPLIPQPLSTTMLTNPSPEWDGSTGIMSSNPDTSSASGSGVSQSGVMNYLNKFGEFGQTYKSYDNVGELYYAAVRYFENLGNVPEWTNSTTAAILDGFPALTTWNDPILYSCQKNFILGIGDDHTWYDYNVGGNTNVSGSRAMPSLVGSDPINSASTWTSNLQTIEGMTQTPIWPFDSGATYFIAGLAYGVHTNDIRPDLSGPQTISTYWMDVAEGQRLENLNPYYLATKYGGFTTTTVPAAPYSTTNPAYNMLAPIATGQYDPTGTTVNMNGNTHYLPTNYFNAGNAQAMVAGLQSAFVNISNAVSQLTTSFSFSSPNVTGGTESFAANFDSSGWIGTIQAYTLSFDSGGNPLQTPLWNTKTTLQSQFAGTGWQSARYVATWNGSNGVPFRAANLTSSQRTALTPSYSSSLSCGTSSCPYLDYLRGDQTNEVGSTASGSTQSLRARKLLLGDIVDAGLTPVTVPLQTFSDANNAGYSYFKTLWSITTPRSTMVYAAANDGMLHGVIGTTGNEQFAYVPSDVYQGPNGTPQVDGLAQIGNPNYNHHNYVDATPFSFDIDMSKTPGYSGVVNYSSAAGTPWRTILIGGLGKGGRSYYALDITNPDSMTSESTVASKVLWEFTDSSMGYSYGSPVVVKTLKYGWTAILTSGYNNPDGFGYLYFVNPRTGALLEKVKTPSASSGLAQASAFVKDYSDDTSDAVYVGDLNGQLWRVDITGTSGSYPAPVLLAKLTDSSGVAQPITSAPLIEIHPVTRKRSVMVGTGVLLAATDINNTQMQSFYAILDGTAAGFTPVSTAITRSDLTAVTTSNLTLINTLSTTSKGWVLDLGIDAGSGIGWRVLLNPQAYNGIVAFSTSLTTGSDPCSPQGSSRVYALDYSTVTSVLLTTPTDSSTPTTVPFDSYTAAAINLRFTGANGTPELIVGFTAGNPQKVPASLTGTLATRVLNWREIPTVE